jgi:hypothetical protein
MCVWVENNEELFVCLFVCLLCFCSITQLSAEPIIIQRAAFSNLRSTMCTMVDARMIDVSKYPLKMITEQSTFHYATRKFNHQ